MHAGSRKPLAAAAAFALIFAQWVNAQDLADEARRLESGGQADQALKNLQSAVAAAPNDVRTLRAYAEFLDQHRDLGAREAYSQLAQAMRQSNTSRDQRAAVAGRLAVLDVLAGDRTAATRHLDEYREAGGTGLALPAMPSAPPASYIEIPGPLRSFARMAGLALELPPEDILPGLAQNVVTLGYHAELSDVLEQTEYLKLIVRYLSQARELEKLAGSDHVIRVEMCESSATNDVLRVIGYRLRGGCGSDVVLETVNAARAFITTDSGFPLVELEQALRANRVFTLDYRPTRIPLIYTADYWAGAKDKAQGEFIDYLLSDPSLCRLYLALSKLDPETADQLRQAVPAPRLKVFAHVLDFYESMFVIRDGKAVVPGGTRSEKAWADLNGVGPEKGAAFFERLLTHEDGWLASYYDALARVRGPVKDYLTDPDRLKRFYAAIRGKATSPGPARPVFRANADMLLLTARLQLDLDGQPHLPGGIDVWKNLFANHPPGKYDAKFARAAPAWRDADDVLEALFALFRKVTESEPLRIFMSLNDIDRHRAKPLESSTVDKLARSFHTMGAQYPLFAEATMLSDASIAAFLDTARAIDGIRGEVLRADAAGTMQALVGLWQVFVRQQNIEPENADTTFAEVLSRFNHIGSEKDVFDGGRAGILALLLATHSPAGTAAQDRFIDLLAGAAPERFSDTRQQIAETLIRMFEAQRLVSLTTLFDLAENLDSVSRGQQLNTALTAKLASRISDIPLPRSTLSTAEKNSGSAGYFTEQHIESQRKLNLRSSIDKAGKDGTKLSDLRGELAPLLRDTLVGFHYLYYAPSGAQVLMTNPLFVRGHDFIGPPGKPESWTETEVFGSGWPSSSGGRLAGSLAGLPYALAQAEEQFLVPIREQALIWTDLVPQVMMSAVIPKWWRVTPAQIHWIGLNMTYGESLIGRGALNPETARAVATSLEAYAPPGRLKRIEDLMAAGDARSALEDIQPSELYQVARDRALNDHESPMADEIRRLAAAEPAALSADAISRTFGTPKPTLANSYQPELLNLQTFPTLLGYSSRIMAESWESNSLYFAALADSIHAQPSEMNILVPDWTRRAVEQIFASHLEDWPALLRSLRVVGQDVQEKARRQVQASN